MKRFEYKILNHSDIPKGQSWLQVFNNLGLEGWEFIEKPNGQSWLFKREIAVDNLGNPNQN